MSPLRSCVSQRPRRAAPKAARKPAARTVQKDLSNILVNANVQTIFECNKVSHSKDLHHIFFLLRGAYGSSANAFKDTSLFFSKSIAKGSFRERFLRALDDP